MGVCRICDGNLESFLDFGRMPIANGFLSAEQFDHEYFFSLSVGFCCTCCMVQLVETVEPQLLFHDQYPFFSSTSTRMKEHFHRFAVDVQRNVLQDSDPFVVELGSNDGILLRNFAERNIRHLGIEPSNNVADVARSSGVNTLSRFFNPAVADEVVQEYGQADAVLAANVVCHIPDLRELVEAIATLLKPRGLFIFEDPYLGNILAKTAYDQIYDEHVYYFSLAAISNLLEAHRLEVVDVIPQAVHGGSMRYVVGHQGQHKVAESVGKLRAMEVADGFTQAETFHRFRRAVEQSRNELLAVLSDLKKQGKRVVGYAATSKSTTVTNYCGITSELVEFISDTTPDKQGKYSPGTHIPVRPYSAFTENYPDVALLFAWNHLHEIMEKEANYHKANGKWLVFVPKVQLFDANDPAIHRPNA